MGVAPVSTDRKSTRLNSSHTVISYAVFCLKKKKDIADFANCTGETVFDATLKEALEVQLRQSPFLSVLAEQRVQGTLRFFFFNDTATTEIYTLSLHDALPI